MEDAHNDNSMTVGDYEQIVTGDKLDIPSSSSSNSPKTKRIYRLRKTKAAAAAAAMGLPRSAITCAPIDKEGRFRNPNISFVLCERDNMGRGNQSESNESSQTNVGNDAGTHGLRSAGAEK
ncbi:697_t:CDS:2, partial [Paraglomus occultum]